MGFCPRGRLRLLAAALFFGTPAAGGAPGDSPAGAPPELPSPDRPLNLQVYGLSYHTDREGARRAGLDNQLNLGLGLNYTAYEDERGAGFVEAGFYRDSASKLAKIAGVGYQFKLDARWRLGGALFALQSPTYNDGGAFIAPAPILTYDLGAAKLNAIYFPRYKDYNRFNTFGFYFSVPLR